MMTPAQAFQDHLTASLEADQPQDPRNPTSIHGQQQSLFIQADKKQPHKRHYRLFVDSFGASDATTHHIHQLLLNAESSDTLEIRLNNHGGSVAEGLRLIHVMENQFSGRSTVVLECNALSMAAMVFAKGDVRIIHPNSRIMFHNYLSGVFGKGGEITDRVEAENTNRDRLYKEVVAAGYLSEDEYTRMLDGKDIWLDAEQICERGLATHVLIKGERIPAEDF